MGGATRGGRRDVKAAVRETEGTSRVLSLSDVWAETAALERGRVQVTFLVDPRFLEVAREQEAELERLMGCELLVSERQLGQVVISGLPGQAQTAAGKVRAAIRCQSRREQGQVRRNGGRLNLPTHPRRGPAEVAPPPGGGGTRQFMCPSARGACGHSG